MAVSSWGGDPPDPPTPRGGFAEPSTGGDLPTPAPPPGGHAAPAAGPRPAATQRPVGRSLVIKVTTGKDDPERCNQALTVAAAAAASGVPVSLWLTGEAAWFALPGRGADVVLPYAVPMADLLATVLSAGTVTVCTQCAARRAIGQNDMLAGVRIAGATTFLTEILADGAQALVY